MLLFRKNRERQRVFFLGAAAVLLASLISAWFCDSASALRGGPIIWPSDVYKKPQKSQNTYRSPEDAVNALIDALSTNDAKKLYYVLGSKGQRLVFSDDETANRAVRDQFLQEYQEKNRIIKVSSRRAILEMGNEDRPFPVPIEKVGKSWRFYGERGRVKISRPPDQQK
jgi:hypothetical protein